MPIWFFDKCGGSLRHCTQTICASIFSSYPGLMTSLSTGCWWLEKLLPDADDPSLCLHTDTHTHVNVNLDRYESIKANQTSSTVLESALCFSSTRYTSQSTVLVCWQCCGSITETCLNDGPDRMWSSQVAILASCSLWQTSTWPVNTGETSLKM